MSTFARKYGIALVHTQGTFRGICKELIESSYEIGANVSTLTDYDAVGIKIAKAPE